MTVAGLRLRPGGLVTDYAGTRGVGMRRQPAALMFGE
jgi:hypothetical protein